MKSTDDARVVHVYVDDLSLVIADDVHDWLRIIGDVDEMKTQYDTSRQTFFYWVRFRHSASAQQAVNYLDGERLKNQVVTIRSLVFSKRIETNDADESPNPTPMEAEEKKISGTKNKHLPYNHLMPSHIQMDAVLVDCIASLSDDEFVATLRELQESYCRTRDAEEAAHRSIEETDKTIKKLLLGEKDTPHMDGGKGTELSCEKTVAPHSLRRIRNTLPIPHSLFDPATFISKFTRCVGPVTGYSFSGSSGGDILYAVVEFLHSTDRGLALRCLSEFSGGEEKLKKRSRLEVTGENPSDDLQALSCYGWCEDDSICPIRCESLSASLSASHEEAFGIISSLCKEKYKNDMEH